MNKKQDYKEFSSNAKDWLVENCQRYENQSLLNALNDGCYLGTTNLSQEDTELLCDYIKKYKIGLTVFVC